MKILVTGSKGQIGRALVASVPKGCDCRGISHEELDLADGRAVAELVAEERPDWVINSGAYTAVDRAEDEEAIAMAINGDAPGHLAEALQKVSGRLLQISTDYVFDGVSSRPYLPNDSTSPLSVYGRTKVAGERAAGSNSIILRTSWVYSSNGSNFVLTMLGLMKENKVLRVVDDQIGAPSWAQGVARVIWDLVAAGEAGIFHHRDAGETSWHGFAVAIAEESYKLGLIDKIPVIQPIRTAGYPTAAPRPAYSVLDDSATRVLLGYTTQHWRENLRQMLKELARHS